MSKPIASPWADWSPWTVIGDRRIVASERAWRVPLATPKARCPMASRTFRLSEPGIARIRVVPDLFEDWRGPMADTNGRTLYYDGQDDWHTEGPPSGRLTLADVRRRVFDLIDQTPGVDWLVSTAWPERVAGMMPPQGIGDFRDSDTVCTISLEPRPNLWLGARISTQAEADARIPCLLRLPAARRWLNVSPTEGIDLLRVDAEGFGGPKGHKIDCIRKGFWSGGPLGFVNHSDMHDTFGPLAWVRIAADAHPDAAKSLVEQCRAAGVPCWHEGDEGAREMP